MTKIIKNILNPSAIIVVVDEVPLAVIPHTCSPAFRLNSSIVRAEPGIAPCGMGLGVATTELPIIKLDTLLGSPAAPTTSSNSWPSICMSMKHVGAYQVSIPSTHSVSAALSLSDPQVFWLGLAPAYLNGS